MNLITNKTMGQLIKKNQKSKSPHSSKTAFFDFIFSNAIGISGLVMLICFVITEALIYLIIASILSFAVLGLVFIMSTQGLWLFKLEKCYVEIEAKFLDLTLYSGLVSMNLLFLIIELFRIGQ